MKKLFLLCLFALPFLCGAAGKPVGLWYGPGAPRLSELMRATLFNPQWCAEKPVYKEFKGDDFDKYSAIVYLQGDDPLRFRPMTKEKIAALEKYVRKGGTLLILADRSATGNAAPGEMATLLGGKAWVKFDGSAEAADPAWKDCTAIPQVQEFMLHGPVLALTKLTTAKPVFSAGKGTATGTVNTLGKGKVWFFNLSLTHSLPPYRQPYNRTANAALEQLWPFTRHFHAILMEAHPLLDKTPREKWDPAPCGPKVCETEWKKPVDRNHTACARKMTKLEGDPVVLVRDGAPCAVIASPLPSQRGAAKTLIRIVREMTGAELVIGRPKPGQAVIRFVKTPELKIVSRKNEIRLEGPSEQALYTFLREFANYRMLWPGKDGEVIPKQTTFSIPACELTDAPALKMRTMRNGLSCGQKVWKTPEGEEIKIAYPERIVAMCNKIGMDPRVLKEKQSGHGVWWSANRLGGSMPAVGGANFYGWPKKYGKKHPEYFALQFDGSRKVSSHNVRICKSNPEVIAAAAKEMAERMTKEKAEYVKFSPSDGGYDLFCMCPKCRAWDPADGPLHTTRVFLGRNRPVYQYVNMTDRVLRFTSEAGKELQKTHPEAKIFYLAYAGYLKPPSYFRDVPKNLVVTFVGLDYLNDDYLKKTREYWDIWAGMAQEMVLRPNLIGGGSAMPVCYVHEMDKDIKHCYQTGMIGADFDTVPHHWATMGLNYYVLAQLLWNPLTPVDEIIDDYCKSGFGPGADAVKEYFALCEKLTKQLAANRAQDIQKLEDLTETGDSTSGLRNYLKVFTPEKLAKMAGLLEKAHAACAKDSPEQHRVEFLQSGLRFTTLRLDFARKYHAAKGQTKTLGPDVAALRAEYQKIFDAYPFAVNYPNVASHDFYTFWRNCGKQ